MTGTFDDWAKSVKLEKKGDYFEKLVELPLSKEKIYYKVRSFTASQVESPPAGYPQTKGEVSRLYQHFFGQCQMLHMLHASWFRLFFPGFKLMPASATRRLLLHRRRARQLLTPHPTSSHHLQQTFFFVIGLAKNDLFLQSKACSHSPIFEY